MHVHEGGTLRYLHMFRLELYILALRRELYFIVFQQHLFIAYCTTAYYYYYTTAATVQDYTYSLERITVSRHHFALRL